MTTPLSHGYADFDRSQPESDVVYVNDVGQSINADRTYSVGLIGNVKALYVVAISNSNQLRVTVKFWANAAFTAFVDSYDIDLRGGDTATQLVPVLGPFVQVVVSVGAATPVGYDLSVVSAPQFGVSDGFWVPQGGISKFNTAIAGLTTVTLDSTLVVAGPAVWECFVSGGNWSAHIDSVDRDGTATVLSGTSNLQTPPTARAIYLPPTHIRITVTNSAAGAQAYNAFLTSLRGNYG